MANDIGGVWRTIGGRRVFIKDGQDLASAMRESGKFKNGKEVEHELNKDTFSRFSKEYEKDKKKHTIDKNDINALNELADSGKDINDYYGLDDIAKDYIKNRRQEMGRNEFTKKADEIHKKTLDEKTKNLEDGKEIHDVFRQMDAKEMEAFAKQNPESIKKMQDYLKSKKINNDNEDKISAKQFKEASKIDEPLERAIQMQVADDVGKTLNDDDIRFRAENYIRHNYNGEASTKEIYEKLKSAYKNNGTYDNNSNDLMTAEQLKGKNREEQKEINKQYLKEQNKLAKEKNDANFAKEWYEGTKKTENMAKENLERAKRNGASVEDLSNRTKQVHELELESQKAQEHSNKMNAKTNASNVNKTANYSQKELNDVYKKEDYTEVISNLKQSEINKMNEAAFDMNTTTPGTPGYNNAKEFIQKMENKAAAQFLDKQNKVNSGNDVMNNNIRKAYQEYKKKHPGSKINFSKFKGNYKS